jgi:hypothetical protein
VRRGLANNRLLRFQDALRTLLDDLTGVAMLSTVEDQVELTIRLTGGKGTVKGRVEAHAIAALEFEGTSDQSFWHTPRPSYGKSTQPIRFDAEGFRSEV